MIKTQTVLSITSFLKSLLEPIQIELRDDQDATLKNGDSKMVIVDEITRNAQFPLKARAITVNGNASQGTIEALINVIYTWQ
ncbi:fimbrial protein [Escherichia coli]|nr:fimbrial protein [Escherichia coli]MDN0656042.1 fimbrial protein [Escherichia coli]MDN0660808.1 fimbrial protein [Escherichia coli]MDN0665788.1 fimbrial protein [Escherichia coli]MDN0670625.1 fimbrial protein [Escherichia coli]